MDGAEKNGEIGKERRVAQILRGVAKKLAVDFEEISSSIKHSGAKGQVREAEILEEYLEAYLPGNVAIQHSGEIVATNGGTSRQEDLLVIDPKTPPLVEKESYRVVPAECVYGVIEVKSHLSLTELRSAHENVTRAKKLPKSALQHHGGDIRKKTYLYGQEWDHFPKYGAIIAYESTDLESIREALEDLHEGSPLPERVDAVWVLGEGLIVNWSDERQQIVPEPKPGTRLRCLESDNPLLLMTIHLQQIFQAAWMPYFRLQDYLGGVGFGEWLEP